MVTQQPNPPQAHPAQARTPRLRTGTRFAQAMKRALLLSPHQIGELFNSILLSLLPKQICQSSHFANEVCREGQGLIEVVLERFLVRHNLQAFQ